MIKLIQKGLIAYPIINEYVMKPLLYEDGILKFLPFIVESNSIQV